MRQTVRLFCFPYSGASASVYSGWRRKLPTWIDVRPVELPGRGLRREDPLVTRMEDLLHQVEASVLPHASPPFALFGHSMGAVLAYELACSLTFRHALSPSLLFASGTCAPSRRRDERYANLETDNELVAELRRLNGTPQEVLGNAELMSLILPVLRADFAVCGNYRHHPRPRLPCPLQVLVGREDPTFDPDRVTAWAAHTNARCDITSLSGGHLFIHQDQDAVLELIRRRLSEQSISLAGSKDKEAGPPLPEASNALP